MGYFSYQKIFRTLGTRRTAMSSPRLSVGPCLTQRLKLTFRYIYWLTYQNTYILDLNLNRRTNWTQINRKSLSEWGKMHRDLQEAVHNGVRDCDWPAVRAEVFHRIRATLSWLRISSILWEGENRRKCELWEKMIWRRHLRFPKRNVNRFRRK